jgi:hypothetical protein
MARAISASRPRSPVTVVARVRRWVAAKNRSKEALAPYEEFSEGGRTYYFTPGGFLYRKDPGTEEIGGFFCGFLPDET